MPINDPCVMTGCHRVEPQGQSAVKNSPEFDVLVAAQARVRRAVVLVLGEEVGHHLFGELGREIPYVERDTQSVGNTASISSIVDSAAATGPASGGFGTREGQMNTHNIVARINHASCGY
jgi:hypothetical protein